MAYRGFLKQSTQVTITIEVISSTDHISGKPGLSAGLTIYATKAGVSPSAITPTVAEIDNTNMPGLYSLVFTTTHTNTLGEFAIYVTGSGADPLNDWWAVSTSLPGESVTVGTISNNVITAASIADGAIDAATFAANAIDSAALATSAVTEIWAQACTEPTAVIAANPTAIAALSWLATLSRNKITQTSTTQILKADDGSTTVATSTISDDGTTFTKGEFA